jgi:hypothetical protein
MVPVGWRGPEQAWRQTYELLVERVVRMVDRVGGPCTIVEVGAGLGILAQYVARERRDLTFLNIDREPIGLCFSIDNCRTEGVSATHVLANLKHVLADKKHCGQLLRVISDMPGKKIVVSKAGLFPFYTRSEYEALVHLFAESGVIAGLHVEHTAFRTDTYERLLREEFLEPPPITSFWTSCNDNPFDVLKQHFEVVESVDLWPHFPYLQLPIFAYCPSYLAWIKSPPH